ncbi:hypothetical protein T09_9106 [Trichinella sp. T9]|nr:hypothetical protein T09_9106 [Trichinella sp. T9]
MEVVFVHFDVTQCALSTLNSANSCTAFRSCFGPELGRRACQRSTNNTTTCLASSYTRKFSIVCFLLHCDI